jgi:hypothetical protein
LFQILRSGVSADTSKIHVQNRFSELVISATRLKKLRFRFDEMDQSVGTLW